MADIVTGQDEPQRAPAGLREVIGALRKPKIAIAALFGIATGMPPVMVTATLGFWLRQEGVALAAIGFMAWVGVFISTKFLWAPFVDRIELPWLSRRLGRRRAYMVAGQIGVTVGILGVAATGPQNLPWLAAFALLTSFSSATQDIAVDAWRIESATDSEQDLMAAAYIFGLRSGYFLGNAPLLAGSAVIGWAGAYALAALGGAAALWATLAAREAVAVETTPMRAGLGGLLETLFAPVKVFHRDHGSLIILILPLVSLYFVPDALINAMVGPLYVDLGFKPTEIAAVRIVFSLGAALTGVVVAGLLGLKFGTLRVMGLAVVLAGLSNLGFAALALSGGDRAVWIPAAMLESFSGGMANAAIVAWAGRLTNPQATAAQFALLSSLMTLLGGLLAGFSGLGVEALQRAMGADLPGYALYFGLTLFACLPPLALIVLVARRLGGAIDQLV